MTAPFKIKFLTQIIWILVCMMYHHTTFAQTPVANRVKAAAKSLGKNTQVVAKYTDDKRHALYYTYNNRLYKYDVITNQKTDINFTNKTYDTIENTWLTPNGDCILISVDRRTQATQSMEDGKQLWKYNTFDNSSTFIGEGFEINMKADCIEIKKGTRYISNKTPTKGGYWMARNHYYYKDGNVIYSKEEYKVK